MVAVGALVSLALIVLGLKYKTSKCLYIVQLIWLMILFGFNNGGPDYDAYVSLYDYYSLPENIQGSEILYKVICYLSGSVGLDFVQMNIILTVVSLLVIFCIIPKVTKNKCVVVSMLMIFPLIDNIIQKRFFYATPIIFLAFYVLTYFKKYSRFTYLLLCIIAAQIHASMYLFIPFVIIDTKKLRMNKKTILLLVAASCLLLTYIISNATGIGNGSKIYEYFYNQDARLDSPLKIAAFCAIHGMFVYIINKIIRNEDDIFCRKTNKILLLSLVFLPLYAYNSVFFRIIRLLILFGYIAVAKTLEKDDKLKLPVIALTGYLIANFLFFYCFTGEFGFEQLVVPVFDDNLVLNFLFA